MPLCLRWSFVCNAGYVGDVSFQFFKRIVLFGSKVELTVLMCQLSQRNGFVSQAYRPGLNWERFPVVARELFTSAFDAGAGHSWMAYTFFGLGLRPPSPNW